MKLQQHLRATLIVTGLGLLSVSCSKSKADDKAKEEAPLFYFHPEDEVLQKHAAAHGSFQFTKEDEAVADSKRAFQEMGVKTTGCMILIEAAKFEGAVKAINEYLAPPVA